MSVVERAKPGRPPKASIKPVVAHTHNPKNIIEFVHPDVMVFKKIFYLLRILNSKIIIFEFKKNIFQIKTEQTIIKIDHEYYCKEEMTIEVEDVFKIMDTIHKTFTSISFIILENKSLLIKFFDGEIKSDVLSAVPCKEGNNDIVVDYKEHNLHFELSCSYFKKTINNLATLSTDFTIKQIKNQPLLLEVENKYQVVLNNIPITYEGSNFFTTTCKIQSLIPLATGLTGECIIIHAHINKKMIMEIKIADKIVMFFIPR